MPNMTVSLKQKGKKTSDLTKDVSKAKKNKAPHFRKITITFNVSQADFELLKEGHIGIHVNFRDNSINTVREPWECPHCNEENQPDTMYCAECSEFVEYGDRL